MKLWEAVLLTISRWLQARQRQVGTVVTTSGTKVVVTVGDSNLELQRLSSYTTPAAGDRVAIDCFGDFMLVIGKIA